MSIQGAELGRAGTTAHACPTGDPDLRHLHVGKQLAVFIVYRN